jgi:molecular chaperone DnaJ
VVVKNPCEVCRGQGRKVVKKNLVVNVPAGVDTGTQLRLTGEGEGGHRGGPPGDLYVEMHVRPDERFVRRDQNLLAPLEISYLQAILGAEVEVETLRGQQKLHVPRGVQNGELVKLAGQGLPSLRGARAGDLIFEIRVEIPKKISREEEVKLREIATAKGETIAPEKRGLFHRK